MQSASPEDSDGMALLPDLADYEVLDRLAVGGMAEIWRARARGGPAAGAEVVLKRLLPVHRDERGHVEMFLGEARLGALLDHPNVVRTVDVFRAGRDWFIVQELVGGETVAALRSEARARGGRLDPSAIAVVLGDLLDALAFLHSGPGGAPVVHRDVNPHNLVASPAGLVKLIDLGVAESAALPRPGPSGALRGTPAYMSPEQVRARPLDGRSDLFAAGVVLWELLANRPLFQQESEFETLRHVADVPAPPLRTVDPAIPVSLERLAVRALAREPERRFQSAAQMRGALAAACWREGLPADRRALAAEVRRLAPGAFRKDEG